MAHRFENGVVTQQQGASLDGPQQQLHQQHQSKSSSRSAGNHHHPQHYGMVAQPTSAEFGFQQQQQSQEGFATSRAGSSQATGPTVSTATSSGQPRPQGGYIGMSPFAMTPAAHGSHVMHAGSVFPRHDNHQHHHQHHQQQHQHQQHQQHQHQQHQHHQHHQQQHHHHNQGHRIGGGSVRMHHHNIHHGHHPGHHSAFGPQNAALMADPSAMSPQGTVMMVYGLNLERVNCDRLFNLFCLYGNVVRVKFLKTKEGCAMVQMGDVIAVDRCVSSLNKIFLFGNELQISYSKQAFLHDVIQPFSLPDGSPSFKDFMGNKNNRFKNPEVASKNRILPPSQVLHFFNAPFGITEDELAFMFKQTANHEIISLKIFTPKTENTKSNSGLVTFRDAVEATEALVLCNHLSMPRAGTQHPYILRLCFSPPTYARQVQHQQPQQSPPISSEPSSTGSGVQPANQTSSTTLMTTNVASNSASASLTSTTVTTSP